MTVGGHPQQQTTSSQSVESTSTPLPSDRLMMKKTDDSAAEKDDKADGSSASITFPDGYFKLCGHISVTQRVIIKNNATLYIAGPLNFDEGSRLTVETGGLLPLIIIREPCSAWVDAPLGNNLNDSGLILTENSTLEILQVTPLIVNPNINTSASQTPLVPIADVHGCTEVYGSFIYDADEIPQDNNYFPFSYAISWTNCTFNIETKDVTFTLPSCPIVWMYKMESMVNVGTATHRLCAGAVAGLSVGLGSAALIGGGAAAAMSAGGAAPAAQASPYVAL